MYTITYIEYSFVTVRAFLKYGRFDGFSFRVGSRYIWSVGLSPIITSWLYTAIVRPMLTYGSVVWINCLAKKGVR